MVVVPAFEILYNILYSVGVAGTMRRRRSNHRSRRRRVGECLEEVVDAGYLDAIQPLVQPFSPFRGKVLKSLQWICRTGRSNIEQVLRCGPLIQSIVKAV